jgi:hypothetical protein
MPIRSCYPHLAVHHDRPILASSLDRRRGREELSRKGRRSSYEEGVHDFGYCPLRPSEGFRQTGRLAHSRSFPSSGVSAANPAAAAGAVPFADPLRNAPVRVSYDPAASDQPRATQSRRIRHMLRPRGNSQEAPDASSTCGTCGTARQKPGRVIVRYFCHWPWCCNEGRPCPRPLSHRSTLQRGGDGATTREVARGSGHC